MRKCLQGALFVSFALAIMKENQIYDVGDGSFGSIMWNVIAVTSRLYHSRSNPLPRPPNLPSLYIYYIYQPKFVRRSYILTHNQCDVHSGKKRREKQRFRQMKIIHVDLMLKSKLGKMATRVVCKPKQNKKMITIYETWRFSSCNF